MLTIFSKVLVIFLMMAVGYLAQKKKILPEGADDILNTYVMKLACPCLIISSMATSELRRSAILDTLQVAAGTFFFFIATLLIAWLFLKAIGFTPKEEWGMMMVAVSFTNTGFMGFPVTKAIFGSYYLFLLVIQNIIFNLYMFILTPMLVHIGEPRRKFNSAYLKSLLQPTTIASFIGLVLFLLQTGLPAMLEDFFSMLGDSTIPVSMVVVGFQLAKRPLSEVLTNGKLVAVSFFRMLAIPLLTFLAVNWLPFTASAKVILLFAACFPTAVIPATIAADEGKDPGSLSSVIALTTAMSLAILPLAAFFLMHWYGIG